MLGNTFKLVSGKWVRRWGQASEPPMCTPHQPQTPQHHRQTLCKKQPEVGEKCPQPLGPVSRTSCGKRVMSPSVGERSRKRTWAEKDPLHYPGEPVGRFLRPGEREMNSVRGQPRRRGRRTAEADTAQTSGAPGAGRETEGPSLEPWGHGERRRDSPWSPRAPGSTLPITQEAGVPPHVSWSDFCPPDWETINSCSQFPGLWNLSNWPGNLVLIFIQLRLARLLWVFSCVVCASS